MYQKVFLEVSQNLKAWGLQLYLAQVFSCQFYEISKNTYFTK